MAKRTKADSGDAVISFKLGGVPLKDLIRYAAELSKTEGVPMSPSQAARKLVTEGLKRK